MNRYLLFAFVLIYALLEWSCSRDTTFSTPLLLFPEVDEELWPYFTAFEDAAASQGIFVDLANSGITGTIEEIHESGVAGQCSYSSFNPGDVLIDESFWRQAGYLAREMIVFHELGHCYLRRSHLEDSFATGMCTSIMRSGSCCCWDGYTSETRSYYIEELFAGGGLFASN